MRLFDFNTIKPFGLTQIYRTTLHAEKPSPIPPEVEKPEGGFSMLYTVEGTADFVLEVVADSEEEARQRVPALIENRLADLSDLVVTRIERDGVER